MADPHTTVYRGRIITLNLEPVQFPNGARAEFEIVHHPGGAAVVAINDRGEVCLLRQYRHAAAGWLWELPAGKLEPGEPPVTTALRELEEEAGVHAGHCESLGRIWSSPGFCTEVIHLYLARELTPVARNHDAHEVIEVHWLPFTGACARAAAGEIEDAKTVIGLLRAGERLAPHSG